MAAANTFGVQARGGGASARLAAEGRLAALRQKLREALAEKKTRLREFVEACKADRRAVREQVQEMRARSLRDLRDQIQAARGAAKLTRLTRLAEVRQVAGAPVDRARAAAAVERQHQAELARLEREERSRRIEIRLAHERSLAAGALRSTLFGKLAPLFEREGRKVTQVPGESRAEALLRFAERNPDKAHAVVEPALHKKVEETKRAITLAERSVRAIGGDVRARGARRPATEQRDQHARQERAAAQGAGLRAAERSFGAPRGLSIVPSPADPPAPAGELSSAATSMAAAPSMGPRPTAERTRAKSARAKKASKLKKLAKTPRTEKPATAEVSKAPALPKPAKAPRRPRETKPAKVEGSKVPKLPKPAKAPKLPRAAKPAKVEESKAPKLPRPVKAPKLPVTLGPAKPAKAGAHTANAAVERKKGQLPRSGPGMALGDLLREREEIAAEKGKGARGKRGKVAKKVASKEPSPVAPAPPAPAGGPKESYAAWCELLSRAAAKHGRRLTYGSETHDAWRAGQDAEAFALTQPETRMTPAMVVREARESAGVDLGSPAANANAPKRPVLVTSELAESVKPYRVRASCGHIMIRKMREAMAGVPYSESVVLNAPQGRACDTCEAKHKQNFGTYAPNPAAKREVKAPELRDTAEIAKRIRADIAEAVRAKNLPKGKYSVQTDKYSMGSSVSIVASKLPFLVLNPAAFHLEKGSSDVSFDRDNFRSRYTTEADGVLAKLNAIVDAYHWDRSDPMTDYHHERFGRDVKLDESGEWKRINDEKVAAARAAAASHGGAQP